MFKPVDDTSYIGKYIHYFPECTSTNSIASELSKRGELSHGDIIITDNQYKGRGQSNNSWISEEGENLTLSIYLQKPPVSPGDQFNLNIAVCLAVSVFYQSFIGSLVEIKWPNDIVFSGKKLSGILIENTIKQNRIESSTLGLGLNINQLFFDIETASSLATITGRKYNLQELLSSLLKQVESYLDLLSLQKTQTLNQEYLGRLYGLNRELPFRDSEVFEGVIIGIDESGRLLIDKQGVVKAYNFKEITFLSLR